uniref:BPTI/Kunitz inhibitor domain-containing protein n=1 Tax=Panagrellus redivivus TaxID=6233 RepID=A0A7E4WBH1_PANRE
MLRDKKVERVYLVRDRKGHSPSLSVVDCSFWVTVKMQYLPLVIAAILVCSLAARVKECQKEEDCTRRWPQSTCRNGRCACLENYIRRKSDSRGWICLSLLDASTSMIGPPLSCPLPDGAGFRVLLKDENSAAIYCDSVKKPCPKHYECIQIIGQFSPEWNGVCCPRQEVSCSPDDGVELDIDGWLPRWFFNGKKCQQFQWNPFLAHSPNTYVTKEHCESYCLDPQKR